jgi:hypothetical protein
MSEAVRILTVWCKDCEDDKRPDRQRLGVVERTSKGTVRWRVEAKRLARLNRPGRWSGWRGGSTLEHPAYSRLNVPEHLVAICPYHGRGYVSRADIENAIRRRCDSISLNISVGGQAA